MFCSFPSTFPLLCCAVLFRRRTLDERACACHVNPGGVEMIMMKRWRKPSCPANDDSDPNRRERNTHQNKERGARRFRLGMKRGKGRGGSCDV